MTQASTFILWNTFPWPHITGPRAAGGPRAVGWRPLLYTFLVSELRRIERLETTGFQQDGATAHTTNIEWTDLQQQFPGWLISRFGDSNWPSRFPDLSVLDFFLWGYLKEKVFSTRKETFAELQTSIHDEIAEIPRDMLANVMDSFLSRLDSCEENRRGNLPDVVFKKW